MKRKQKCHLQIKFACLLRGLRKARVRLVSLYHKYKLDSGLLFNVCETIVYMYAFKF